MPETKSMRNSSQGSIITFAAINVLSYYPIAIQTFKGANTEALSRAGLAETPRTLRLWIIIEKEIDSAKA
jgi:hypothetical protein